MPNTITTIAISERETPEAAANNARTAIENHYLPNTQYHTATVATHPQNDDLLLSAHIDTDTGQEFAADALEQTQTNLMRVLNEIQEAITTTPLEDILVKNEFFLDCRQLGDKQSDLYTLIDTTGYYTGYGIRTTQTIEYITEHTPQPVYAVKIDLQ